MIPKFQITVGSEDYTETINDRLVELKLVDIAGYKSDSLEIKLDDRDNMPQPAHGAIIKAQIGYHGQALVDKGQYTHNQTTFSGPPKQMAIRATAINFRDNLNAHRSRSFDDVTLGDLVTTVAKDHGYDSFVDEFLKDILIPHLDQTNESDLFLLNRLGIQYGATFKASAGLLVFFMSGGNKSQQLRESLGSATLRPEDVSTWAVPIQDTSRVTAVTAQWHDLDAAETKTVKAGEGNKVRVIKTLFPTEAEAFQAAQAKLHRLTRRTATVSITMQGSPSLRAEGGLILEGFRDGVDNEYTITRVDHTITKRGYTCKVEADLDKA